MQSKHVYNLRQKKAVVLMSTNYSVSILFNFSFSQQITSFAYYFANSEVGIITIS